MSPKSNQTAKRKSNNFTEKMDKTLQMQHQKSSVIKRQDYGAEFGLKYDKKNQMVAPMLASSIPDNMSAGSFTRKAVNTFRSSTSKNKINSQLYSTDSVITNRTNEKNMRLDMIAERPFSQDSSNKLSKKLFNHPKMTVAQSLMLSEGSVYSQKSHRKQ